MYIIKKEISKELYEKYKAMKVIDFESTIQETIPDAWKYGYGWYGCNLKEEDGIYYIVHSIGNSCD